MSQSGEIISSGIIGLFSVIVYYLFFAGFYYFGIYCFRGIIFSIMTEKQKNNLAKFFYDIAKIDFAALVVAQFANPSNLKYWILIVGIIATIVPIFVGLVIDKQETEK